ncbi:MAG: hypothetical protein HKN32_06270, partial [Flavobacteriales bacterium]|nr:hypothetical protein [Flavobacteriales bacterium]
MIGFLGFSGFSSQSQGCSDAGFCTMGAMRPDQAYSKRLDLKLRSLELNLYRGSSLLTPMIYVATVDATIGLNAKNYVQIKLPYQYAEGNLGSASGMGDISLSYTTVLKATQKFTLSGTLGGKIPMGDSNETIQNDLTTNGEERPLHMYYQPSLGSYDVVGGVSWINDKWLLATGIQIPLTKNNNQFVWGDFQNYPDQEYLRKYNTGPELMRGVDVMLRVERNWRFTNYNFSIGLLPIWRMTKDNSLVPDTSVPRDQWVREDRDGTTGMALS